MTKTPTQNQKHEHSPVTARLDLRASGVDGRGGYRYGYQVTCSCGATREVQYRSAADADRALAGVLLA